MGRSNPPSHKEVELKVIPRNDPDLRQAMDLHYTQTKGFVGRSICYRINYDSICYGYIVAGSAVRHLKGRNEFFNIEYLSDLRRIINNIFFNVHKVDNKYPFRNFVQHVILTFERQAAIDWKAKYGNSVLGYETLVEVPRTGECYKRAKWTQVGITVGYTCRRVKGREIGTFTGQRIWNRVTLAPKLVFCKKFLCNAGRQQLALQASPCAKETQVLTT